MKLLEGPTRIIYLGDLPRFCGGKPKLDAVAWFHDHVYYHKNAVLDADNISFTLEQDPGENTEIVDGIQWERGVEAGPHFGCAPYGQHRTTLATTRRNELLFRYRHEDMSLPEYPFPPRPLRITPHFMQLTERLDGLLSVLSQPGTADRLDLLALEFITEAFVSVQNAQPDTHEDESPVDPRIFQLAGRLIAHPEENFSVESAAAASGMSRASFYREWARYSDDTPYHFLTMTRLRSACWLLRETTLSVKEIAGKTGFRSPVVFSETFQRHFGISPGKYRKF